MRKVIIYVMCFILICIFIPAIFTGMKFNSAEVISNYTNELQNEEQNSISQEELSFNSYDYKEYSTIKLLHTQTNEIEEVSLDEYLYHVVAAEMPASFEEEALKAQAIVARTYTIYKVKHNNGKHNDADICDSHLCCQAWISKEDRYSKWENGYEDIYWTKIVNAVNATSGKIITYENEPINAFFHANSGGTTEVPVNVWGGDSYPYLQSVQTVGEEGYTQYSSEVILTKQQVIDKIKETHPEIQIDYTNPECIKILEYTEGDRIRTIQFGNVNLSGVEARAMFELKSANFIVTILENDVKFQVKGYGHGVGMSQTGADSLAKQGEKAEEIIAHYYINTMINNV